MGKICNAYEQFFEQLVLKVCQTIKDGIKK